MTIIDFKQSLQQEHPPKDLDPLLRALWFDGKGDWHTSHELAQEVDTNNGAWVHAYLHRKEGDESNALYWYRKAGKKMSTISLEKEWEEIVS